MSETYFLTTERESGAAYPMSQMKSEFGGAADRFGIPTKFAPFAEHDNVAKVEFLSESGSLVKLRAMLSFISEATDHTLYLAKNRQDWGDAIAYSPTLRQDILDNPVIVMMPTVKVK